MAIIKKPLPWVNPRDMTKEEYNDFIEHIDDPVPERVVDTEMNYNEDDEIVYPDDDIKDEDEDEEDEACDDSDDDIDDVTSAEVVESVQLPTAKAKTTTKKAPKKATPPAGDPSKPAK